MDAGQPTDPTPAFEHAGTLSGATQASLGASHTPRLRTAIRILLWGTAAHATIRMLLMFRYSVDVPYWDQWNFVDFLRVTDDGVSWSELWAPHNEHRSVFPNIVLLVLARATHWNVRAEIAMVNALLLARFGLITAAVWRIGRKASVAAWVSVPLLAAFLLTRGQAENLLWGWQVTLTLGALFTLVACLLLVNGGWARFVLAALASLASQFSFASGVALWPVGLPMIWLQPGLTRRTRIVRCSIWSVVGLIATFFYRRHLPYSPKTGPVRFHDLIEYSVKFLGAPLAPFRQTPAELIAWRAGVIGIGLFLLGTAGVAITGQFHRWSSVVMWGLTAPMTAVVTALGRLGFVPVVQSMSSRYITMSTPLWAAAAVLLIASLQRIVAPLVRGARTRAIAAGLGSLVVAGLAMAVVIDANAWDGWGRVRLRDGLRDRAYLADITNLTNDRKVVLFPDPAMIDRQRPYLESKHLTMFRHRAAISSPAPTTVAPTTVAPTTVAPTTVAPTTVATTITPTTITPTTGAPSAAAPATTIPAG